MSNNNISEQELYILSFYRASELAGGLLFGKIAFHTDIDELRIPLTRHAAEEVEHGWYWTKTIKDLGLIPIKVTRTYQTEYGKEFGMPTSLLEILCLTQVLEKRVVDHFTIHLNRPNTHPIIAETLQGMLDDESHHLNWIKVRLDKYSEEHGPKEVDTLMKHLHEIDDKVYKIFKTDERFSGFLK
jgi:demethoxyubiquinone hydroxylase (CLK1/Coq7/Cat5 family)